MPINGYVLVILQFEKLAEKKKPQIYQLPEWVG
jgi:hypothetical protein